ncbi:MAG: tape measure protein [Kangiella sp.]|nr:tape measure protein [Kangiella sp.]MCW9029665.1 tape measure protein [Kangiella sp.]
MNDLTVKVKLVATDQGLVATLKLSKKETDALGKAIGGAGKETDKATDKTKQYEKANEKASKKVKRHARENQGLKQSYTSVSDGVARFRSVYATLAGLLAGGQLLNTASDLEQIDIRLQRLSGSAVAYANNQQFLSDTANRLNRDYLTLADSYARILALQKAGIVSQKEGRQILIGMTDASAALGATNTQLSQSLFGMTQGFTSGTLRAEELNQVTEPIPGLLQELDKAAGLAAGGFRKMVNDGQVTSQFFKETLIKALQSYAGAAEGSAESIRGSWSVIKNAYVETVNRYKEPLSNAFAPLAAGIGELIRELPGLVSDLQVLLTIGAGFAIYKIAAATMISLGNAVGLTGARLTLYSRHMTVARARTIALAGGVRILRAGLAALGGPIGILITAAASIATYLAFSDKGANSTKNFADRVDELTGNFDKLRSKELANEIKKGEEQLSNITAKVKVLSEEIQGLLSDGASEDNYWVATKKKALAALLEESGMVRNGLQELRNAQDDLNESMESGSGSTDHASEASSKFVERLKEQLATLGLNNEELLRHQASVAASTKENKGLGDQINKVTEQIIKKQRALKVAKELEENSKYITSISEEIQLVKMGNEERFVEVQLRKLSASATDEQTKEVIRLSKELYRLQKAGDIDKMISTIKSETKNVKLDATVSGLDMSSLAGGGDYFDQQLAAAETQRAIALAQENAAYEEQQIQREQRMMEHLERVAGNAEAEARIRDEYRLQDELAEEAHNNKIVKIHGDAEKAKADIDAQLQQQRFNAVKGMFNNLSALMYSHNEKAFKIGKAAAIAETIMNTYKSAQLAFTSLAGIPYVGPVLGGIAAGAAIVAGMARVQSIRSQQFQGQAHEGIDNIPRTGTYLAEKGERVVDKRTNADLKGYLKDNKQGGGRTIQMENNFYGSPGDMAQQEQFADYIMDRVRSEMQRDAATRGRFTRQVQGTF